MERILARRQFMRVLTATGLSAAFAGSLLDRALAAHGGPSDADILQLALTAEYLAAGQGAAAGTGAR